MRLNIGQKIFGTVIVILLLMAVIAVLSGRLTGRISQELENIAYRQLPLANDISHINVKILEQGLLLQRLFALPEDADQSRRRITSLGEEIEGAFEETYRLFEIVEQDSDAPPAIFELHRSLKQVEREYRQLERHGVQLLRLHDSGRESLFRETLADFNRQQAAVDEEVAALRRYMETVAEEAVRKSDREEKFLLVFNSSLTGLAILLGLGLSALITYFLVRNLRQLVRAAEAVERGELDTVVQVRSRDEIGALGHSFNDMLGGLRMKERIKDMFGKYMDPRIVNRMLDQPELTRLGGERQEMTVMFIDLQGYTSLSEKLSPPELVSFINRFLSHMTETVADHKGVINDFLGDAVMAYWGPPFTGPEEHAALACETAREALRRFELFRNEVQDDLGPQARDLELGMRIGISTGEVVSGNIGSAATKKFSVLGSPVNLGARLEGANKFFGTRAMASARTVELAGTAFRGRELDRLRVKGQTVPARVFELFAPGETRQDLSAPLGLYRRQDWAAAREAFSRLATADPQDPVPKVFLDRISKLETRPPAEDWDGVWELRQK